MTVPFFLSSSHLGLTISNLHKFITPKLIIIIMSSTTTMEYKNDILSRMGGNCQYEMTIYRWSELILEDPQLRRLFRKVTLDDAFGMNRNLLDLVLRDFDTKAKQGTLRNRAFLQHYRLFRDGMNSTSDFDCLKATLSDALQHSWTDEDVCTEVLEAFETLRTSFFEEGTKIGLDDDKIEIDLKRTPAKKTPRRRSGDILLSLFKAGGQSKKVKQLLAEAA